MQVDGSVVMWSFGLVFTAFAGLIGVIWAMLNKRLNTIEEQAKTDRDAIKGIVNNIYDEIKEGKDKAIEGDRQILAEIGAVRESMTKIEVNSGERRAGCVEKFATKDELNRGLSSIRRSA